MPDATELTRAIKKAASKAVKAEKPVEVCFGKVTSAPPLQILVDQKFTLGAAQLVLTRNVTDFTTNVTVSWNTENRSGGSGESSFASHNHAISGRKSITVHNGLLSVMKLSLSGSKAGKNMLWWIESDDSFNYWIS